MGWNGYVRLPHASGRPCWFVTPGLRADRGTTGWWKTDGTPQGTLHQTSKPPQKEVGRLRVAPALPSPAFLQTGSSGPHLLVTLAVELDLPPAPPRLLRLPPAILSVLALSESVTPGMGLPNVLMELNLSELDRNPNSELKGGVPQIYVCPNPWHLGTWPELKKGLCRGN